MYVAAHACHHPCTIQLDGKLGGADSFQEARETSGAFLVGVLRRA
jgi:hypothetical protein